MCGIFGAAGDPAWLDGLSLSMAQEALRHRGPDASGTFRGGASRSGAPVSCTFAHARLSIIDLSEGGRQPMSSVDGRYTITFNGEIYNFREVRRDLEAEGVRFRSSSDTEVIVGAYARWGKACLSRLRGMFAFGIWDARDGALFLARDRVGIKPLYYTRTPRGLAFASEVRTLLAAGAAERRISLAGVREFLALGSVSDPLTTVRDVFALMPGTWLELRDGRIESASYWQLRGEARQGMSAAEAVAEMRETLEEAARLHLIADVPIGVFLSGGVDSSAVAALACRQSTERVHTFTVVFGEEEYSEKVFAADVARKLGCEHHELHLDPKDLEAEMPEVLRSQDLPSCDGPNSYYVSQALRAEGLKVALSGQGGDEVFGGYPSFSTFGSMLARGSALAPVSSLLAGPLGFLAGSFKVPNRIRKGAMVACARGDAAATYRVLRSVFTPGQVDQLMPEGRSSRNLEEVTSCPPPALPSDPFNALSVLELTGYLRNTLLRDGDVMSMAHALEVRVPLLDHVVVERALEVSGSLKRANGVNKPFLQDSVDGLRGILVNRPKAGFVLPFEVWLRTDLKPFAERTLFDARNQQALPFLDFDVVRSLWGAFQQSQKLVSYSRVMTLLSLVSWCTENGMSL